MQTYSRSSIEKTLYNIAIQSVPYDPYRQFLCIKRSYHLYEDKLLNKIANRNYHHHYFLSISMRLLAKICTLTLKLYWTLASIWFHVERCIRTSYVPCTFISRITCGIIIWQQFSQSGTMSRTLVSPNKIKTCIVNFRNLNSKALTNFTIQGFQKSISSISLLHQIHV